MPKPRAWMFIDETSNLGAGGMLEGASAVIVNARGRRRLERLKCKLEIDFAGRGIPPDLELHAERWVQRKSLFPTGCHPGTRINALLDCLRGIACCSDIWLLHAMVDHSQPHAVGFDARQAVFEQLYLDFRGWVGNRYRATIVFDQNQPGPVIGRFRQLKSSGRMGRNLHEPKTANSSSHFELRLADLCAYFVLQQSSAGAIQVRRAGAQNAIDIVQGLNLVPADRPGVRVVWL